MTKREQTNNVEQNIHIAFFALFSIDDVLSLTNFKICDNVDCIYPIELAKKDTTYTVRSSSDFDLYND